MNKEHLLITVALIGLALLVLTSYLLLAPRQAEVGAGGWLFTIEVNGETFKVLVKDPAIAEELRKMMRGERQGIVVGELRRGDGGFNAPWSWHLDPDTVHVAEVTIELCDGTPSFVESQLDYWLSTVKRFCPWNTNVVAEEPWKPS